MRESRGKRLAGQVAIPLVVGLGVVLMFAAMQRQLIYFPTTADEKRQVQEADRLGLEAWRSDGGSLQGWQPTVRQGQRRMLVFHGNAGYALHREYYVQGLRALDVGWDVYIFEYPGYGARPGSPSEEAIKAAATQAPQSLLASGPGPVYLVGESLGSGVASYLAGAFPDDVAGLLLVTPFTSLTDVAAHHYPWLPVRTLLQERYDSETALGDYDGPIAFLLAGRDEVVPTALGQALHDAYQGPKWLLIVPGAGHNTLPFSPAADWWDEVSRFLATTNPATS